MKHKYILLPVFLILTIQQRIFAQEEKTLKQSGPAETSLNFSCTSLSDDSIQLKAIVSVRHEEGAKLLVNAPVKFLVTSNEQEIALGEAKTEFSGTALYKVPTHNAYPRNSEQLISFKAVYAGNDNFSGSEGEFLIKPARLSVSFYEEDSVRYVKVIAAQINADNSEMPLGPVDVSVSVPRMFSMLKIGTVSVDSTGIGTAEFPNDIIGDSLGNLTIVATVDENDIFGNIKGQANNKWGLHKHLISPDRPSRELWTPIAPLWMIITLIIMLVGVWGHYFYAIIQLVMIKRSSKQTVPEEEPQV